MSQPEVRERLARPGFHGHCAGSEKQAARQGRFGWGKALAYQSGRALLGVARDTNGIPGDGVRSRESEASGPHPTENPTPCRPGREVGLPRIGWRLGPAKAADSQDQIAKPWPELGRRFPNARRERRRLRNPAPPARWWYWRAGSPARHPGHLHASLGRSAAREQGRHRLGLEPPPIAHPDRVRIDPGQGPHQSERRQGRQVARLLPRHGGCGPPTARGQYDAGGCDAQSRRRCGPRSPPGP